MREQLRVAQRELEEEYTRTVQRSSQAELRIAFLEQDAIAKENKYRKSIGTLKDQLEDAHGDILKLERQVAEMEEREVVLMRRAASRSPSPQENEQMVDDVRSWSSRAQSVVSRSEQQASATERLVGNIDAALNQASRMQEALQSSTRGRLQLSRDAV